MKANECTHHWQIEIARGHWSNGKCKNCGAVREFENSFLDGTQHIALKRETEYATKEDKEASHRWNKWFGG